MDDSKWKFWILFTIAMAALIYFSWTYNSKPCHDGGSSTVPNGGMTDEEMEEPYRRIAEELANEDLSLKNMDLGDLNIKPNHPEPHVFPYPSR